MRNLGLSLLFLLIVVATSTQAAAEEWEYRVITLPSYLDGSLKLRKDIDKVLVDLPGGGKENIEQSAYLTRLGAEGWDIVAVTGVAAVQVVYLRRPKMPTAKNEAH